MSNLPEIPGADYLSLTGVRKDVAGNLSFYPPGQQVPIGLPAGRHCMLELPMGEFVVLDWRRLDVSPFGFLHISLASLAVTRQSVTNKLVGQDAAGADVEGGASMFNH